MRKEEVLATTIEYLIASRYNSSMLPTSYEGKTCQQEQNAKNNPLGKTLSPLGSAWMDIVKVCPMTLTLLCLSSHQTPLSAETPFHSVCCILSLIAVLISLMS